MSRDRSARPHVTSSRTKRSEEEANTAPSLHGLPESELVEAAQRAHPGDHRAFTELVRRYQSHVYSNCRYLGSPEDAEDLSQEVLVRAYFGLSRFEGRSSFKTWLDRIKSNHCVNHRKKMQRNRDRTLPLAAAGDLAEPAPQESFPERLSRSRQVDETLLQLSPKLRIPLVLSDMDGVNLSEIAVMLGISLSAAKMRITRGREAFRRIHDRGRTESSSHE